LRCIFCGRDLRFRRSAIRAAYLSDICLLLQLRLLVLSRWIPTGPIQLSDGNFYGTTAYGDTGSVLGTVWQATPSGDVNTLYTFTANGSGQYVNGALPDVALVAGANGNLYGVTEEGGPQNSGVFYSLTTTGSQQVLYNFCSLSGCPDQAARIVLAGDGNFYGITPSLVFRLTPEGVLEPGPQIQVPLAPGGHISYTHITG
jgi:uncharacterized repeat protein (TIGR03803 family)